MPNAILTALANTRWHCVQACGKGLYARGKTVLEMCNKSTQSHKQFQALRISSDFSDQFSMTYPTGYTSRRYKSGRSYTELVHIFHIPNYKYYMAILETNNKNLWRNV